MPKDLKLDLRFNTCFVDIIKAAKIQNWVKKIIGTISSGVIAKNLNNPGACAKPTAVKIFLKGVFDVVPLMIPVVPFGIIFGVIGAIYETLITGINDFHTFLFWFSLAFLSYSKYRDKFEVKNGN